MNWNDSPIIPRKTLWGNPDRTSVQISYDGAHLAWIAPLDGVLNVWVAPRENIEAARPITQDQGRGIRAYFWAYNNTHILYIQDKNGDENWHLYAVELASNAVKDLTPFEAVNAKIIEVSYKFPEDLVVGLNNYNPQWHDIYRINLVNGDRTLLLQHERFISIKADDDYCLRFATQMMSDGSKNTLTPVDEDWELWDSIPADDTLTTTTIGFDKTNQFAYSIDSRNRDTAALYEVNLETKAKRLLAENAQADVSDVIIHPTEKHIQAVAFTYDRKRWQILDEAIQPDLDYLSTVVDGEIEILSRTQNDLFWVVVYLVDDGPARYYLYDRPNRSANFLFTNRQALAEHPLVKMYAQVIPSRDGLDLVAYYSLPPHSDADDDGIPDQPLPMVFNPHGGPWARDSWGYNPQHQWLANRGYVTLNVNFRSSIGFGKNFINAGNLEWGGKIMEDQIDAVQWAITQGIADPEKVAIMGASFGGYSTLAGLTMYPETFACGVDIVGPSNLMTLIESLPPYWQPVLELFTTRMGDNRTEEGQNLLRKHSPLTYVNRIARPLLIAQGVNDPRVKQAESDQIVTAMQAKDIPVTYVLYPDEGHGFARPENRLSFYAIAEAFLAQCLGGRAESIGNDFEGASLTVTTGAEEVPGLAEALSN